MRKINKYILMGLIIFVTALYMMIPVGANAGGFTVVPNLPENQDDNTRGFFDLIVTPGQKQELTITVSNVTFDELQLDFNVITATTASSGVINYGDPGVSDKTLAYSFADMAQLNHKSIRLPGNTETEVTVSFVVPEAGFSGSILGSIVVAREPTQEEIDNSGMIVNRHRQIIAVRMRMNDDDIIPDFKLGDVSSALTNHRASIIAEICNPVPGLFRGVSATAWIYPEGNETAIFEVSNHDIAFAPNSIFHFSMVDRAGFGIQAGKYTIKILLEYEGTKWEFDKNFEILPEEAGNMNKSAVNQQQLSVTPDNVIDGFYDFDLTQTIIICLTFITIIIAIITFIIIKKAGSGKKKAYIDYMNKYEKLDRENQLFMERILSSQERTGAIKPTNSFDSKPHKVSIQKKKAKDDHNK